ncbi:hypothetical protein [Paraburkholderia sp. GAS32]|uniref:hypothetical protein n=1 Tax=Paraburkholderia sp. GAS32 TaxID=3035129 RepID=UPI003D1ECB32
MRTLDDTDIETGKPIEIVVWANEEGARFTPAVLAWRDAVGVTVADALRESGYAGTRSARDDLRYVFRNAHRAACRWAWSPAVRRSAGSTCVSWDVPRTLA